MAPIGLGIIGYGIMGERLLRAALEHADEEVRISGVFDPSPAALDRLAADFEAVPRLASAAAVIEAADCLYVAAPPAHHLEHAERAIARGRAVFCEKPLAVDVEAARRFAAEVDIARMAVNFPFASSPAVEQLVAWQDQGVVGELARVRIEVGFATWPRGWQMDAVGWLGRRAQGGFTREVVSQFLFLARRLLGPLTLRSAHAEFPAGDGAETAIQAELTADELPITVTGAVGETDRPEYNRFTIEGSAGAVRLRDWSIAERQAEDGSWEAAADAEANERMRPLVLRGQLEKVARMTRGEPQNLATVQEALEVQAMVEAILRA